MNNASRTVVMLSAFILALALSSRASAQHFYPLVLWHDGFRPMLRSEVTQQAMPECTPTPGGGFVSRTQLSPGTTVTLSCMGISPSILSATVSNQSDENVMATLGAAQFDGSLTIAAPAGFAIRLTETTTSCSPLSGQRSVLRCFAIPGVQVSFTTVPADVAALSARITSATGWNLVAGPTGTILTTSSGPLHTYRPDDSTYQAVRIFTALVAGIGYWAYFDARTPEILFPGPQKDLVVHLPPGQYALLGNPFSTSAQVTGADIVYTYSPGEGYRQATTLQPGRGAWVYSTTGGTVTIGPATP
ncbi:MAG: hypothetical protein ACR2PL_02470 [Dehalococcoidia bacterium]